MRNHHTFLEGPIKTSAWCTNSWTELIPDPPYLPLPKTSCVLFYFTNVSTPISTVHTPGCEAIWWSLVHPAGVTLKENPKPKTQLSLPEKPSTIHSSSFRDGGSGIPSHSNIRIFYIYVNICKSISLSSLNTPFIFYFWLIRCYC